MAVTVEEALELIYKNTKTKDSKILPIEEALGSVIATDIVATHNLPPYDNSAMDGYAVKLSDSGCEVKVTHTIFAGDNSSEELIATKAIKIMTGAKIPQGTECIVPQEDTTSVDDGVRLPANLTLAKHIRLEGEDIKSGDRIIELGERLYAHHIAIIASQGLSHVEVYKKPRIAIFASGSELKMHFQTVESYQLYNTNTPTFTSRVLELGCEVDFIGTAGDSLDEIKRYVKSALDSDIVITSGGVSVGDADFTKEAFGAFGYEIYFDKVAIKPGKPTTVGKIKDTMILNLPGNPLAASLNFELFGRSMILAKSGERAKYLNVIKAKMAKTYKLRAGRRTIVPGIFDGEFFTHSDKFAPGMVSPLGIANSFIMIDDSSASIDTQSIVNVIPIRFMWNTKLDVDLRTY